MTKEQKIVSLFPPDTSHNEIITETFFLVIKYQKMHQLVFVVEDEKETIYSPTHTCSPSVGCVFIMHDLKRWCLGVANNINKNKKQRNQQFDQKSERMLFSLGLYLNGSSKNKNGSIVSRKHNPQKQWITWMTKRKQLTFVRKICHMYVVYRDKRRIYFIPLNEIFCLVSKMSRELS